MMVLRKDNWNECNRKVANDVEGHVVVALGAEALEEKFIALEEECSIVTCYPVRIHLERTKQDRFTTAMSQGARFSEH